MTAQILAAAGIPHQESRFPDPPPGAYAVYMADVEAGGADGINCLFIHDATVELYLPNTDTAAEDALEAELATRGLPWTKQARYWISTIQRYQVVYEFTIYEKRRV